MIETTTFEWSGLIGYDQHRMLLSKLIKNGSLPPILLLSGREGLAKKTFAVNLAALHFCTNKNACGCCAECQIIKKNQHPNILYIGGIDGVIKSSQTAEVEEHLFIAGSGSGASSLKRVCIISDAEQLTQASVNKLLKTLESTPPSSFVVFTSGRKKAIASTLLSRCVNWHIAPPEKKKTIALLKEQYFPVEDLDMIERALIEARFSPGLAQRSLANKEDLQAKKTLDLFIKILDNSPPLQALIQLEEWKRSSKIDSLTMIRQLELALNKQYKKLLFGRASTRSNVLMIAKRRDTLVKIKKYLLKQKIAFNVGLLAQSLVLDH